MRFFSWSTSMSEHYSQSSATSTPARKIALVRRAESRRHLTPKGSGERSGMTSLDEKFRQRFIAAKGDMTDMALSDISDVSANTIGNIVHNRTESTKLNTVEKLAKALKIAPATLLGLDHLPVNEELLCELLLRILRTQMKDRREALAAARAIARVYAVASENEIDPTNQRDLDMLTSLVVDQLRPSMR